MRATLLLNGPILSDDGLLGPALKCSEVAITSNQNMALAASVRPSKTCSAASSASANTLLHVWPMNHVALLAQVLRVAQLYQPPRNAAAAAPREWTRVQQAELRRVYN